ncbi:hypothetical protein GWI33_003130 [Rhynchophorus ferrugineus]|uniref:Uncharacterized protein n=1 Tax=Rhynchophorus ferrugineus TaxID=354439 RepID=A0A834HXC6_RHYFE|nr:hypothetical protein GWI33_003130 [Rhynchophorus ferrugineus]
MLEEVLIKNFEKRLAPRAIMAGIIAIQLSRQLWDCVLADGDALVVVWLGSRSPLSYLSIGSSSRGGLSRGTRTIWILIQISDD